MVNRDINYIDILTVWLCEMLALSLFKTGKRLDHKFIFYYYIVLSLVFFFFTQSLLAQFVYLPILEGGDFEIAPLGHGSIYCDVYL